MGGLEAAREITLRRPQVRIIMFSVHDDEQYIDQAKRAGSHGYVCKSAVDHDLLAACRSVIHKTRSSSRADEAVNNYELLPSGASRKQLTGREAEILALVARGKSAKQIAEMLVISDRTVERHRENLMRKLEVHTTAELTRHAIRLD